MNKEQQIEEMVKVTAKSCEIANLCGSCNYDTCNECLAEVLYNAGYRKASELIDDIIDYINENEVEDCKSKIGHYVGSYALNDFLNLLKEKCTEAYDGT